MFAIPPLVRCLTFAALALAIAAQAAERRETRSVSGFTAIGLAAPIKLQLVQGDTESLVLEGEESALAELDTAVEKGELLIRPRSKGRIPFMTNVRALVTAKTIESLRISGAGDISAAALRAETLKLAISGAGDIRIGAVAASGLDVAVSGSGDVTVAGRADTFVTGISGSGDVRAAKLEARDAKVSIAGSGDVTLWAKQSLAVRIAGSGDVRYYGDPALTKSVAGSGSIKRAGAAPS